MAILRFRISGYLSLQPEERRNTIKLIHITYDYIELINFI